MRLTSQMKDEIDGILKYLNGMIPILPLLTAEVFTFKVNPYTRNYRLENANKLTSYKIRIENFLCKTDDKERLHTVQLWILFRLWEYITGPNYKPENDVFSKFDILTKKDPHLWSKFPENSLTLIRDFLDHHRARFLEKNPKHRNIQMIQRCALDFFSGKRARRRSRVLVFFSGFTDKG